MYNGKRRIVADEEVNVAPEATDLLFEAEDVADLIVEVTGQPVEVTADGDAVTFAIGDGETVEEYTVTAEGDEEIVESATRVRRGRTVAASRRPMARRPISASRRPMARQARPVSASRRPMPARRTVAASTATRKTVVTRKAAEKAPVKASKVIRRVPAKKTEQ